MYKLDPSFTPLWGEAVDMRKRCTNPSVPARIQHNVVAVALSTQAPVPQLTAAEIISDAPLSKPAWFIRQLTTSTTQKSLDKTLDAVAPVRDKSTLFLRCDSFAPMYSFTTDWRDANVAGAYFGFSKPYAFRFPMNYVTPGLQIVYPPRSDDTASDEGPELCIGSEMELTQELLEDAEWSKYFVFRGIDAEQPEASSASCLATMPFICSLGILVRTNSSRADTTDKKRTLVDTRCFLPFYLCHLQPIMATLCQ